MKIIHLLFFMILGFCDIKAQISEQTNFQVALSDPTTKPFFNQHSNVDYITITYEENKAGWLSVYLQNSLKNKTVKPNELYMMSFEGDAYLFKRKYPQLILPKSAALKVKSIPGIKDLGDKNIQYQLVTTLRRDSTFYDFMFYTYTGKLYPGPPNARGRAAFKGDVDDFQKRFTVAFREWKPIAVSDSVLFISGIAEKNGSLSNVKLETTKQSLFSKKCLEFIEREAITWWPAVHTGRKVSHPVKLFVRLNKDDSITFSAW